MNPAGKESGEKFPAHARGNGAAFWFAIGVGVLIALVYGVCVALWIGRGGFWIIDNGCRFIQMEGLIRNGYRAFDVAWPGAVVDPELKWMPLPYPFGMNVGGRLMLQYSPVFAVLSSAPYRAFGFPGLYLLPLLGGLALLPAVYGLARRLSPWPQAGAVAVGLTGLASPLWFYSLSFWEHAPAVALATWSVLTGVRFLQTAAAGHLAASALLGGLAIYLRDELYLLAGIWGVALWLGTTRKRIWWFYPAVVLLTLLPLWGFNFAALGNPFGHHFAHAARTFGLRPFLGERLAVFQALFLGAHPHSLVSVLLVGPWLVLWLLRPVVGRKTALVLAGWAGLGGVFLVHAHAASAVPLVLLLQTGGLFAAAPVLALGFVRAAEEQPGVDRRVRRALLLLVAGFAAGYALLAPPFSARGIHWGCRFLLPLYPLLAVLAAHALVGWWRGPPRSTALRSAVAVAVAAAVLLQIYSVRLLAQRLDSTRRMEAALAARPERAFIANNSSVAAELVAMPNLFFERLLFLVRTPAEADRLRNRLSNNGIHELAWMASAVRSRPPAPGAIRLEDRRLNYLALDIGAMRLPVP